jgi:hypothetical protein
VWKATQAGSTAVTLCPSPAVGSLAALNQLLAAPSILDDGRMLIEVLLAHRTLTSAALGAAMTRAVASGVLGAEAVLIDARRQVGR